MCYNRPNLLKPLSISKETVLEYKKLLKELPCHLPELLWDMFLWYFLPQNSYLELLLFHAGNTKLLPEIKIYDVNSCSKDLERKKN